MLAKGAVLGLWPHLDDGIQKNKSSSMFVSKRGTRASSESLLYSNPEHTRVVVELDANKTRTHISEQQKLLPERWYQGTPELTN